MRNNSIKLLFPAPLAPTSTFKSFNSNDSRHLIDLNPRMVILSKCVMSIQRLFKNTFHSDSPMRNEEAILVKNKRSIPHEGSFQLGKKSRRCRMLAPQMSVSKPKRKAPTRSRYSKSPCFDPLCLPHHLGRLKTEVRSYKRARVTQNFSSTAHIAMACRFTWRDSEPKFEVTTAQPVVSGKLCGRPLKTRRYLRNTRCLHFYRLSSHHRPCQPCSCRRPLRSK